MLWAMDFQFDSAIDDKTIEIASMIDERTRQSSFIQIVNW